MKFPKVKNALLCRILMYVVVLGGPLVPAIVVMCLSCVSEGIKVLVLMGCLIGGLIYLLKNFVFLTSLEIILATIHCWITARKYFTLPERFSVEATEKRIAHFGRGYEPVTGSPRPAVLRHQSRAPMTASSGVVEKTIATYHVELLDRDRYRMIVNSATANARALEGKKKHYFLSRQQRKATVNRVSVIIIYAQHVEEKTGEELFSLVCQNVGDGYDTVQLPCVVDLEKRVCTFDSQRMPNIMHYPAKTRGINLIRKYLFHGRFPYAVSPDRLECGPEVEAALEQSLWSFWRTLYKDLVRDEKERRKRFEKMHHGEILFEDGYIYLKWGDRGIWSAVERDETMRTVEIDMWDSWYYPKSNAVAKSDTSEMKRRLNTYFAGEGYSVRYSACETDERRRER